MLLDPRRFQAHAVRNDEARAAADPVRLDPREVAMPADLRILRSLSVDRDGTVRHDKRDFLVGGRVLEMLGVAVQRVSLLESLALSSCRTVPSKAELPPHDVRDQDAQGLSGPAGRADRTCVGEV